LTLFKHFDFLSTSSEYLATGTQPLWVTASSRGTDGPLESSFVALLLWSR